MSQYSPDITIDNVPLPVDGSGVTQPVSGTFWPATQPVSGTVSISGSVATTTALASSSAITSVVLTNNTNGTLLSANANRKKVILFVPSQTLYIKLGSTASTTSFTYQVAAAKTSLEITGWAGQIDAFGSGQTVTVTELS